MREEPKAFEKYKHFKGNTYQILNIALDSETLEKKVVYQALYGENLIYVRSLVEFLEPVDRIKYPDAKQEERFEKMGKLDCKNEVIEEPQEIAIDPFVLEFLDATKFEDKLNILAGLHHRITDEMINMLAAACDLEIDNGPIEQRYEELKKYLLTRDRFESNRIR